ncbi:hypothetical protein KIPB_014790, partial [Kipferlia bialata]
TLSAPEGNGKRFGRHVSVSGAWAVLSGGTTPDPVSALQGGAYIYHLNSQTDVWDFVQTIGNPF